MCYENKSHLFTSLLIVLIILLFASLNACTSFTPKNELEAYTPNYFDSVLTQYIPSEKVQLISEKFFQKDKVKEGLNIVYNNDSGKKLRWQTADRSGHSPFIKQVINACKGADMHGFSAKEYPVARMQELFDQLYVIPKENESEQNKEKEKVPIEKVIEQKIELDVLTSQSALALMNDVYFGRMPKPKRWDYPVKEKDINVLLQDTNVVDFQKLLGKLAPQHPGYYELAGQLQKFLDIQSGEGLPLISPSGYSKGKKGKNIDILADRLAVSDDLEEPYDGEAIFDDKMVEAIKNYQQRNGIKESGTIDQKTLASMNTPVEKVIDLIRLNLERYRWLPEEMTNGKTENYIFVNIPEYHVRCYKNGEIEFESITVVGETITPTPVFQDEMEFMVFSPVWNIPASIAREEIFQYALINPGVLIAGDTEVYYKGKKVNPYSVDWKQAMNDKRSYSFRQKPTNQNSMGDVKFKFPNDHGVYLHDTPAKKDFKLHYRAKSSGCVRVGKPAELAEYLLKPKKEDWTLDRIKRNMSGSKERRVNMQEDVKIHIYYLTAWVDENGQFRTAQDIYKHDKRQLPELKKVYGT